MPVKGDNRISMLRTWDKDFIEALAFIGIEVGKKPQRSKKSSKS